jgi:hypothetical protein
MRHQFSIDADATTMLPRSVATGRLAVTCDQPPVGAAAQLGCAGRFTASRRPVCGVRKDRTLALLLNETRIREKAGTVAVGLQRGAAEGGGAFIPRAALMFAVLGDGVIALLIQ